MFKSYIESLAFQPPRPATYEASDPRFSWVPLTSKPNSERIAMCFVRAPGLSVEGTTLVQTILYSHGNAEDIGQLYDWFVVLATTLKINVCGYDYVGYGPSGENSTCSESANYKSVDAAMRWVQTTHRIPIENIVLYGRSLGGGATVHAAVRNPGVQKVILQSTFTSAARVVVDLSVFDGMLGDIFINQKKIGKINAPILIIHGEVDEVIPVAHGRQLHSLCKIPSEPLYIQTAGHNNIETSHANILLHRLHGFLQAAQ